MSGFKYKIFLLVVLTSLFSIQAFTQQINFRDSISKDTQKINFKPEFHYSVGSSFLFVPKMGSFTAVTLSPFLSIPMSPKLSVDGGIIAGRFYSAFPNFNREGGLNETFNELSLFGSASYHINSQLTVYGIAMKQLTGYSPFNFLPKSSYTIGSSYKIGNSSIGLTLQMLKWNDINNLLPFSSSQGFYSPY